jgi:predicted amidohydrolase YtcJ
MIGPAPVGKTRLDPGSLARASSVAFVDVEVEGRPGQCVEVVDGVVAYIGPVWDRPGATGRRVGTRCAETIDGRGGALLPGLHDHHLHLLALAARGRSVVCGPPEVNTRTQLGHVLRRAARAVVPGEWIRGVGYDETSTGPLDAQTIDALLGDADDRPVRIQHRSGHQWVLNGAGVTAVRRGVTREAVPGAVGTVERGIFVDGDRALRAAWSQEPPPGLGDVGAQLSRVGCTGVTDASVGLGSEDLALIERSQASGELPQRVHMLVGGVGGPESGRLRHGPRKIILSESSLPSLEALVAEIAAAGDSGVALHCVSRQSLVLAAVALQEAGGGPHRIEHASVAPPEVMALVASLPVTVVTQPGFVAEHGDRYRREVEAEDLPWLYRLGGWQTAAVAVAGSTDAPFGSLDPWAAMRAAVSRRTAEGASIGADEAVSPEQARDLFLGPLEAPGDPPRRVRVGAPADLCLLSVGWTGAREVLDQALVRATFCAGVAVHGG